MFEYKCELYLNGSWQSYDIYNQLRFDERKDGQVTTALCYIRTEQKTRFEPMREARIEITDKSDNSSKVKYFFAYFKGQQRQKAGYWLHEVMLIDPAKRTQGELINGLRVIQNDRNSITLYDTFVRLCNTTPLRLTSQSNLYNPTAETAIVNLMKSIRSPEYAWSCRTLFWECLKEIGMDMGGYFPTVEFGSRGQYIISFFPTERKGQEITDFDCISLANGYDESQVCSEIDTDISNIIATNQGTASVVFPSQVGWVTPRTDDVQLTTDNCEIQVNSPIQKVLKVTLKLEGIECEYALNSYTDLGEYLQASELDVTKYFVEFNRYKSLETLGFATSSTSSGYHTNETDNYKNNTCYWTEGSTSLVLVPNVYFYRTGVREEHPAIYIMIQAAVFNLYGVETTPGEGEGFKIIVNGEEKPFFSIRDAGIQSLQFRVEYILQSTSTKIRAVKQGKCGYEYVAPYNQRAEVVDAEMLGAELDKTVNQLGVDYIKAVSVYRSLSEVLPLDTVYKEGNDSYMLVCNEYEATNKTNIRVTHTFSKNWSMLSSWLKQNKQYRNTRIPTDILARNLHYQDYFVISETDGLVTNLGEKGLLSNDAVQTIADVFNGGRPGENTEINNFALYRKLSASGQYRDGVVVSCDSFGIKKSIVLSAKMENNLTAGRKVDPDNEYYCQEVLYTDENGKFPVDGAARMVFGILDSDLSPNALPQSNRMFESNLIGNSVIDKEFYVDKSSAEQIAMTYQVHFVTEMPDIVIGGLIANNSPLVQDRTEELKYQLWGLTSPLDNLAVVVDSTKGVKLADITSANREDCFVAYGSPSTDPGAVRIELLVLMSKFTGDYIGWAITDENGRLYIARNSHPNVNQSLYFNHLHKYHEQD